MVDALNDHNKAANAPGLASQAYDAGADLLMDIQNAPVAMAVSKVAQERHRLAISTNSASPALNRSACNKYFYHYSYDSTALETATAAYLTKQPGGKRWVMIVADAGFGKGAAATMGSVIKDHGKTEPHAWFDVVATVPAKTAFPAGSECKMAG